MSVPNTRALLRTLMAATALLTASCADGSTAPTEPVMRVSASVLADCERVLLETTAPIGPIEVAPGVITVGALPTPATIAGISGTLGSIVTGQVPSGARQQGAQHLTLVHIFASAQGTFTTTDRAVCAPAGTDAGTCRINDVLSVTTGTGVFANAAGSFRNQGVIDFNQNTVSISLRGRICADGL